MKVSPTRLQEIFQEEVKKYKMEEYDLTIRYGYTKQFRSAQYVPDDKEITINRDLNPNEKNIRTLIRHEFKHV